VTYGAVRVLGSLSSSLVLIGIEFFLALGLEPVASWVNRKLPRWAAHHAGVRHLPRSAGGLRRRRDPPLAQQANELIQQAPHYLDQLQDHSSVIGRLNDRFHLQQRITATVSGSGGSAVNDVFTAGSAVFGAVADTLIVIVLTVYFLIDMPRVRTSLYRLVPHTRRPRAILIGD
jgi:predicted PurR-regulated permease PerM